MKLAGLLALTLIILFAVIAAVLYILFPFLAWLVKWILGE